MLSQAPIDAKRAAKELCNINPGFIQIILRHLADRYAVETLIGDTSDETLRRVYRRDGKLEVIRDLEDLFFPHGV